MKTCSTYVVVAAMAMSGIGMCVNAADDGMAINNTASGTAAQMQQTGGQMADEANAKVARALLAKIVNEGVEADKFSSLTSYLAKSDRERFGDVKSINIDNLNTVINQFRSDFKAKYNQEFDISGDNLKNAMVYAGQDKNSATVSIQRPAGNSDATGSNANTMNNTTATNNGAMNSGATADRPLNTMGNDQTVSNRSGEMSGAGVTSSTAGNRTGPASNGQNSSSTVRGNDVTATPGVAAGNPGGTGAATGNNDMANANMNNTASASNMKSLATAGMSGTTLNLVNEGRVMNAWRISAPQLSAEQFKQNLVKHIQMLDDQKAAWPTDVNAAYQATAYHVLSAFSDASVATER